MLNEKDAVGIWRSHDSGCVSSFNIEHSTFHIQHSLSRQPLGS